MQTGEQTGQFLEHRSQADHSLEVENGDLRAENHELRSDLEECQAQLLKSVGQDNQISEASLKDDYTRIYRSIEVWVEDVLHGERLDFKHLYKDMLRYKTKHPLEYLKLEHNDLDKSWLRKNVRSSDFSAYFVLSSIISRFLYSRIFRRQCPVGILDWQATIISEILDCMQRLKQDESVVNEWRSQTLSMLVVSEQFKEEHERASREEFDTLKHRLASWLPSGYGLVEKCESMLRTNIFEQAIELHKKMCCSTTWYQVCLESFQGVGKWDTDSCTFLDVSTWRTVDDLGADQVFTLYPALRRIRGEQTLDLVGPTILITRPHSRTTSRSSTMETSPERKAPSSVSSNEGRSKSVAQETAKPQSGIRQLWSFYPSNTKGR